ncbi:EIN3-binding F-box protein 1-like [Salvia miltiorrhiza]|uniref:EIN3-binding F-box protein 1-like n=1 Tax=Salvia miltiorrhiza TaxID=226208 RepID=UPI0025AC343D|nr:EIN3-binding F-box protein 1-like [Salvia miltiorrhiza]
MSKVFDFSGDNEFFMFQNPKGSIPFVSLGSHVDVYFPPRKRSRISAPFVVTEDPKELPSIEVLPDECLFEIFRRLGGGEERSACASVSKRWLMLLSSISADEICGSIAQTVESEVVSDCKKADEQPAKPKEKVEIKSDDEECVDVDPQGYLSRCLEGKKATDVRLAAISVGTASRGGLGKLSIRGNASTRRLTDLGLKVVSRGCPSLRALSLWNLSCVGDEGLSAIATGCRSLEKLDLSHCPAITDKAMIAVAMNCPNLRSVTLESCSSIGDESLKALGRHCPNLECVMLKNCALVGDQGVAGLFSSAGHVLTKASLQGLNVSDVSLAVIGHYGSAMTALALGGLDNVNERGFWVMGKGQGLRKLRSLSIASCQGVTDAGLEAIGKGSPDLKVFSLRRCALVSDNGVVSLAKAASSLASLKLDETHRITQCGVFGILASCGGLKALAVSNCLGLKDMNFGFPLNSLCTSLRSLAIHNCPGLGDSGLSMVGRLCPKLTHVDLRGLQGVTDAGLLPLVQRPEAGLSKVNLSGCVNLTDNVVAEIANLHGETLEILNLERCSSITDVSLMSIATNCSVLRELDVSGCRVTDSGVALLARAEQLSLRVLSLAGCSLVSDTSFPSLKTLGRTLVGLNIQLCHGISSAAVNLLLEQLWRCDILS